VNAGAEDGGPHPEKGYGGERPGGETCLICEAVSRNAMPCTKTRGEICGWEKSRTGDCVRGVEPAARGSRTRQVHGMSLQKQRAGPCQVPVSSGEPAGLSAVKTQLSWFSRLHVFHLVSLG
jgi:hypothetical protein